MRSQGFSLLELMIVILVIGIIAAIAIPNLVQSKIAANEGAALSAVRNLVTAQYTYKTNIAYVVFSPDLATLQAVGLIDEVLSAGTKDGYTFSVSGAANDFDVLSRPISYGSSGFRGFYADETGVVRYTTADTVPTSADTPVGG